ncbi:MAG: c-type cytochrome [Deltaproteobacteria bacterium]|nr:c-type cytochrome [Deltaproteobacteria bacterium]
MIEVLYEFFNRLGYTHPLHPPLTHLPLGLLMGALIFGAVAVLRRHSDMGVTAHHCTVLALIGFFPTVLLGYLDWQHHYKGAMLFEIRIKLILAAVLFVALILAVFLGRRDRDTSRLTLVSYVLCLALAGGMGYFGGELVFKGGRSLATSASLSDLAKEGEHLFMQNCAACHLTDSTEARLGPGLKGLFQRNTLVSTGQPVTEEAVRRQIREPTKLMPPFPSLTAEQMDALLAYLKSI